MHLLLLAADIICSWPMKLQHTKSSEFNALENEDEVCCLFEYLILQSPTKGGFKIIQKMETHPLKAISFAWQLA